MSILEETVASPLIAVENLQISFAGREVVKGISFSISAGETVGIVGESGSGKSVTVRSLVGLTANKQRTTADKLEVFGQDARNLNEKQWTAFRGAKVGFVLQDALSSLDPLKTIGQEVAEAANPRQRLGKRRASRRILDLLSDAGIPEPHLRTRQYSHELSGGLRQRALIATALAQNPPLLIADEPTTALDVTVQAQILALLRRKADEGHALLLVSHDLAVIGSVCDRILVMREGEIVEQGPTREILTRPRHRYTQLLLAAIPSEASRGQRLSSIEPVPLPPRTTGEGRPVLTATGVTKDFTGRHGSQVRAVDDVNIELFQGQTLGIVGESGSGKSTLARIIAGLVAPSEGSISLDGKPWSPLPEKARRSRRGDIHLISQNPQASFDPRYSVATIIGQPLKHLTKASPGQISERVEEVLDLVQLPANVAADFPQRLSGGQRQRVAIARAIVTNPRILIADEAVSALDVSVQAQILDLLSDIQAQTRVAILFISHDLGVIHHLSDSVVVMRRGRIVERGAVDDVLVDPEHPYTQELLASLPRLPQPHSLSIPTHQ